MVSLTRSFFYAGTPAVVASLWSVNDRASAALMESFYRSLSSGASRAQALREAKAAMRSRARYRHPYYWAGFVLLGDGEGGVAFPERAGRAAPGGALLLLCLVAAVLAAGIASRRRWARRRGG